MKRSSGTLVFLRIFVSVLAIVLAVGYYGHVAPRVLGRLESEWNWLNTSSVTPSRAPLKCSDSSGFRHGRNHRR